MKANKIEANTVVDYTIDNLLNDGMLVTKVRNLINLHFYDTVSRLRAAMIVSGQIEEPDYIPLKSIIRRRDGDIVGTFQRYDIFTDNVTYEYPIVDTYYFKTKEDAEYYVKTGDRYRFSYKSDSDEEYIFEGTFTHISTSIVSLESWIENEVK